MSNQPSVTVTPARLSFTLAIVAALGIVWQTIGYTQDQRFRLEAVETYITEQRETNKELIQNLNQLSTSVIRLTVIMESQSLSSQVEVNE